MGSSRAGVRRVRLVVTACLIVLSIAMPLSWTVGPGSAHNQGFYAVRFSSSRGYEIRWREYTRYDGPRQHGRNVWEQYGLVNWAPDNSQVPLDLSYYDYTDCNTPTIAFYASYSRSRDTIEFNTCRMNGLSSFARNYVAAHESGHALGLGHNGLSGRSIMYTTVGPNPSFNTPRAHDINDYRSLWS
jgi:hypothetical protein